MVLEEEGLRLFFFLLSVVFVVLSVRKKKKKRKVGKEKNATDQRDEISRSKNHRTEGEISSRSRLSIFFLFSFFSFFFFFFFLFSSLRQVFFPQPFSSKPMDAPNHTTDLSLKPALPISKDRIEKTVSSLRFICHSLNLLDQADVSEFPQSTISAFRNLVHCFGIHLQVATNTRARFEATLEARQDLLKTQAVAKAALDRTILAQAQMKDVRVPFIYDYQPNDLPSLISSHLDFNLSTGSFFCADTIIQRTKNTLFCLGTEVNWWLVGGSCGPPFVKTFTRAYKFLSISSGSCKPLNLDPKIPIIDSLGYISPVGRTCITPNVVNFDRFGPALTTGIPSEIARQILLRVTAVKTKNCMHFPYSRHHPICLNKLLRCASTITYRVRAIIVLNELNSVDMPCPALPQELVMMIVKRINFFITAEEIYSKKFRFMRIYAHLKNQRHTFHQHGELLQAQRINFQQNPCFVHCSWWPE